jgi:hypothetical protein
VSDVTHGPLVVFYFCGKQGQGDFSPKFSLKYLIIALSKKAVLCHQHKNVLWGIYNTGLPVTIHIVDFACTAYEFSFILILQSY